MSIDITALEFIIFDNKILMINNMLYFKDWKIDEKVLFGDKNVFRIKKLETWFHPCLPLPSSEEPKTLPEMIKTTEIQNKFLKILNIFRK